MVFLAVGDAFITRALPRNPEFDRLKQFIESADVRICNLETTFASDRAAPATVSGGTWAKTASSLVGDLQAYGFNGFSAATNHAGDFGEIGMLDTLAVLQAAGAACAGLGTCLEEAGRAVAIPAGARTCHLLSLTSTFHESAMAGNSRLDMKGRPGINPLRHQLTYVVDAGDIEAMRAIDKKTGINDRERMRLKEGFSLPQNDIDLFFGGHRFKAGVPHGTLSEVDPRDLDRSVREIRRCAASGDPVIVSIHTHDMKDGRKELPADFIVAAARTFIEAGASAIVCHGPHVMRGIEIYRKRPIFYGLGNFVFQNETVAALPADFYEKYQLDPKATPQEAFDKRSHGDTKGLVANPAVWRAVIPRWALTDGELTAITLHPIALGFGLPRSQRGSPALSDDIEALKELQTLCAPFGTRVLIHSDGTGSIALDT